MIIWSLVWNKNLVSENENGEKADTSTDAVGKNTKITIKTEENRGKTLAIYGASS